MKRNLLTIIAFTFFVLTASSQDFQGKAIYQAKTSIGEFRGRPDMPEAQRKRIMERIKKESEKTFELVFNKSEATYIKEEKLEAPSEAGDRRFRFGAANDGKLYKNIQDKSYTKESEMFGKVFLIKDKLQTYNWVMGTETKKIGNYTCYKATAVIPRDTTSLESLMEKRRKERDAERNKDEDKQVNVVTVIDDNVNDEVVTAWFTTEIPISNGPGEFWSLPGLILEVSTSKTVILCTKIVLNSDEKTSIAPPKKGKEISQVDYDVLLLKKMDEMSERFRSGRRGGGGPGGRRN